MEKLVNRIQSLEKDVKDILNSVKIDVRIIGSDYIGKDFTGKNICVNRGIEIHYNKRDHAFSSSELRNRINGR